MDIAYFVDDVRQYKFHFVRTLLLMTSFKKNLALSPHSQVPQQARSSHHLHTTGNLQISLRVKNRGVGTRHILPTMHVSPS